MRELIEAHLAEEHQKMKSLEQQHANARFEAPYKQTQIAIATAQQKAVLESLERLLDKIK